MYLPLQEDLFQMPAHVSFGHAELIPNFLVGQSSGDQSSDLDLPRRERRILRFSLSGALGRLRAIGLLGPLHPILKLF